MSRFPSTSERAQEQTSPEVNRKIALRTEQRVRAAYCAPGGLGFRQDSLKHEWDVERVLETNAAGFVVLGSLLGLLKSRWFLLLPLAVGVFLLQHALQGWCPPLDIIRRFAVRTSDEIAQERAALGMLKGDIRRTDDPVEALSLARTVFD